MLAQLGLADASGAEALRFKDPADVERPLIAAGFADVSVQIDTAIFRYADVDEYWRNARGTGLRRWLDALDAVQVERVKAALAERLQPHRRPDGIYLTAAALLVVVSR